MAETLSMALAELLRKADAEPDLDTLREGVRVMTQALMELEVASIWALMARSDAEDITRADTHSLPRLRFFQVLRINGRPRLKPVHAAQPRNVE
jgi:hypothetical protein